MEIFGVRLAAYVVLMLVWSTGEHGAYNCVVPSAIIRFTWDKRMMMARFYFRQGVNLSGHSRIHATIRPDSMDRKLITLENILYIKVLLKQNKSSSVRRV